MTATNLDHDTIELDARSGDGIDVRLCWSPISGAVTVSVFDTAQQQAVELRVDPRDALDGFHHRFAYAAYQGIPFETPFRAHDDEPVAA